MSQSRHVLRPAGRSAMHPLTGSRTPAVTRPLLAVRDLVVRFALPEGALTAVDGVSFTINPGRITALVGESGSGKSVLTQAVMGLLPSLARIDGGSAVFTDPLDNTATNLAELPANSRAMRRIRGGRIGMIFQEPMSALSPLHTLGDQITEAVRLHLQLDGSDAREVAADMLHRVGFPNPRVALDRYPFELSGGLRQRGVIAMALAAKPALLIADEPTTALDVTLQAQILKLLRDLQDEMGMGVLLITHDLGVVASLADDMVVLYRGKVMEAGPADTLIRDPRHAYLKALLGAVPRIGMDRDERLVPLRAVALDPKLAVSAVGKHGLATTAPTTTSANMGDALAAGTPLLSVEGLTKRFVSRGAGIFSRGGGAGVLAVDNVSFTVGRAESVGLVGESGCGKTTTSRMLLGAIRADEGRIMFRGDNDVQATDLATLSDHGWIPFRRRLQYVFQDPFHSLNPRMTVYDIIAEPLEIHGAGTARERAERVKALMKVVGLDIRHLRRYPHSFSGGQRQRIGIARALALGPELLILDEPVSALDVSVQAQVLNLLKDLQSVLGLGYLFISHNLAVVDYMCDRILVMCAGRIVESAPRDRLFSAPTHPYTRALIAAVPEADPDRRLDFAALMDGRASDPAVWPEPWRLLPGGASRMSEIAPGHFVRVGADMADAGAAA
ncbi:ABC transporter ATP-binding protein [Tistrella bauzanensis]|uniref:ABC transporter ATP-binding protein n=2 Tax=Tistrella bauzanensis TaxID=657419 RepID=A0ABQ1IVA6_9PROT|nr:ABC transporter ATP-binding protein [Tistrella bauzanensis]GGB51898.1 ABC transporter ATP-binding protein [Tistrella bauzanensis]